MLGWTNEWVICRGLLVSGVQSWECVRACVPFMDAWNVGHQVVASSCLHWFNGFFSQNWSLLEIVSDNKNRSNLRSILGTISVSCLSVCLSRLVPNGTHERLPDRHLTDIVFSTHRLWYSIIVVKKGVGAARRRNWGFYQCIITISFPANHELFE